MRLKSHILICYLTVGLSFHAFAQLKMQKKADELFNNFAFDTAAQVYESLLEKGYNANYIARQLGDCYAYMRNPEKAATYYQTVVQNEATPLAYYYKYAQALRGLKAYETSRVWLEKFKAKGGILNDSRFINDADFITAIFNAKPNYSLKTVNFNSVVSDFGAFERNDTVYFTSTANKGVLKKHRHAWDKQPFLDLYATPKSADTIIHHRAKLKGRINSTYHDGPAVITKDGNTMYFSRNDFTNDKLGEGSNGINNLKIYKATLVNGKWSKIKELPFNNKNYSVGHPALNNDDSKLYFTSDMPGGVGGADIYYVTIGENGSYGTPTNAGPTINTEKNEVFPFVNAENTLFFSSDGHQGIGLLDIFVATQNKNTAETTILNLGVPINSSKDDFSFFMTQNGTAGYIASNREGGLGKDDIYAFDRIPQLQLTGKVTDTSTQTPISNSVVKLSTANGNAVAYIETNSEGIYRIDVDRDANYIVSASKAGYESSSTALGTEGLALFEKNITANFSLTTAKINEPIAVTAAPVIEDLGAIFFNFDTAEIQDNSHSALTQIINTMLNTYPEMTIKIEAFSDARGPESYNMTLSQKRANATYNYLIANGIAPSRIIAHKGYGEHESTINCEHSSKPCSEEAYKLSRRTNFIVVKVNP